LQFVQGLGFPGDAGFFDVYGFDDDLLAMVPTPVLAVLLLFPISPEVRFYPLAFA
jgi:ubiquitin carboxyl-terminal hydrolase L3